MPIAAAPPPQSADVSDSDPEEELGEDEEYEEIEVEEEEEIEVEEEVSEEEEEEQVEEVEEEEEEEEEEEDPEEVEEEEEVEGEEEEEVEQDEEVQKEEEEDPEEEEEEEFGEDLSPLSEDHGKGEISHMDDDSKLPLLDNGILNADPINPFDVSVKEVTAAVSDSMVDGFKEDAKGILYPKDDNKRKVVQNGDEISQMETRSDVFIRPSSMSPGLMTNEGNKRPAVICDFFAKGWCIKGNSCRFLHVRDHKEDASQQKEGSEASANPKSGTKSVEGLIEGAEGSGFNGVADAAASERIPPWEKGDRPSWKSESSELQEKDNPRTSVSLKTAEKENLRHNWCLDRSNSPLNTNNLFHGTFFTSSTQSSDIYGGDKVSSYATSTSQLTAGISQSNHGSAWTRQPFSFSSSSWSTDPLGTLRRLDDGKEIGNSRSASLHRSSSPRNGSESDNLSRSYVSGYRTKFSSSDWEPSIPFRPSFPITQSLLSHVSQYDPIRDSIEQPNIGSKFSRFSSSSQETSIMREDFHPNSSTALTGTFSQEFSSNKLSQASPQNICEKTVENSQGEDLSTSQKETPGIAPYEQENETTLVKEDKFLSSSHDRDMKKESEVSADRDFLLRKDGSRHKEMKADGHSQNNDVDFDIKGDISMQRESRALKLFRGALIDFVKELVKPTWREGNLSKDAHKVIVKKTVNKVLSALPPDQIPSTPEYVEMYLCLSQPKIAKVVEVYVDKYGKS